MICLRADIEIDVMTLDILRGVQGIGAAATIPASVCPSLHALLS
jgi:hypothetical protein